VRFTDDDKSRVGTIGYQQASTFNPATDLRELLNAGSMGTHKTTWRLGADYDLARRHAAVRRVATGYKAGGFNDGCLAGTVQLGLAARRAGGARQYPALPAGDRARLGGRDQDPLLARPRQPEPGRLPLRLQEPAAVGRRRRAGAPRFVTGNAGVASVKGLEAEGQLRPTRRPLHAMR
jgi:iron complex outermembrane receptor protein